MLGKGQLLWECLYAAECYAASTPFPPLPRAQKTESMPTLDSAQRLSRLSSYAAVQLGNMLYRAGMVRLCLPLRQGKQASNTAQGQDGPHPQLQRVLIS
jgi:hypothetical protein